MIDPGLGVSVRTKSWAVATASLSHGNYCGACTKKGASKYRSACTSQFLRRKLLLRHLFRGLLRGFLRFLCHYLSSSFVARARSAYRVQPRPVSLVYEHIRPVSRKFRHPPAFTRLFLWHRRECSAVITLPRKHLQVGTPHPHFDVVIIHFGIVPRRVGQHVLIPRFFGDPRVKLRK